jgi:hypothetical protein
LVDGSKPTSTFGCGPVSTNQRRPRSSISIAYGFDSYPLGAGHSFTAPVAGSRRPMVPSV